MRHSDACSKTGWSIAGLFSMLVATFSVAHAQNSPWTTVDVFSTPSNSPPLEIQVAPLQDGNDPTLGIMVLYNDGQNRLWAIQDDPPYFDNVFSQTTLPTGGGFFAIGDICRNDSTAVMPYVDNQDVFYYQYNDVSNAWGTPAQRIPQTDTPPYLTADCVGQGSDLYVGGFNDNTDGLQVFRSQNNGGSWGNFAAITNGAGVTSPGGANGCGMRDTFTVDPQTGNIVYLWQSQAGPVNLQEININTGVPGLPEQIASPPAPNCSPFVLRESDIYSARVNFGGTDETTLFGSYSDGQNSIGFRRAGVDLNTFTLTPSGAGSQYNFRGTSVSPFARPTTPAPTYDAEAATALLEEAGWVYNNDTGVYESDPGYPETGIGGPVESCTREELYREIEEAFFGPDQQTFLYAFSGRNDGTLRVNQRAVSNAIFRSSFSDYVIEDTWNCTKPYEWP